MRKFCTLLATLLVLVLLAGCSFDEFRDRLFGGKETEDGTETEVTAKKEETASTSKETAAPTGKGKTVKNLSINFETLDDYFYPAAMTLETFLTPAAVRCADGKGEAFVAEVDWSCSQYQIKEMAALDGGMPGAREADNGYVTSLGPEDYLFSNRTFRFTALVKPEEGWTFPADLSELNILADPGVPAPEALSLSSDGQLSFTLSYTVDYKPMENHSVELCMDYPWPGQAVGETFIGVTAETAHAHYEKEALEILSLRWEDQNGQTVSGSFDDTDRSLILQVKLPMTDRFADEELRCSVTDHSYGFVDKDGQYTEAAIIAHPAPTAEVIKKSDQVAEIRLSFAGEHQLSFYEGYAAGCLSAGEKDYYLCADCGRIFADEEGKVEIRESDLALSPTGHTYVPSTYSHEASCSCGGRTYEECSCCGKLRLVSETPALGHDFVRSETESKLPTCTANGYDVLICTRCGQKEIRTVYSSGHQYSYKSIDPYCHQVSCDVCGRELYREAHEHPWEDCSLCGYFQVN